MPLELVEAGLRKNGDDRTIHIDVDSKKSTEEQLKDQSHVFKNLVEEFAENVSKRECFICTRTGANAKGFVCAASSRTLLSPCRTTANSTRKCPIF